MKKKRLGKLSLDTMEFCFQPLQEEHLRGITGGGYVSSYTISGGTITNWSYDGHNYAVYTDNSGRVLVLDGVHVGSNTMLGNNLTQLVIGMDRYGSVVDGVLSVFQI